jgi:hypothetical protein
MATPTRFSTFADDVPVTGKGVEFTASASGTETEVHNSAKGYWESTAFATHGLLQDHYKPVDSYEGLHRYDPNFEWEPEEEQKVVWKVLALL